MATNESSPIEQPASELSDPTLAAPGRHPGELASADRDLAKGIARAELFGDPPPRLGRFELIRLLGEGGMGSVYLARDPDLEREVAIKVIHSNRAGDPGPRRKRLVREAQLLARFSHPNVVQIYEVGVDGGRLFIVMEYVRGQTLRDWFDSSGASWTEVLAVMRQAGEALVAAHEASLVHRDFKPHNVMLDERGRVRVLDFGIARDARDEAELAEMAESVEAAGEDLTHTGTVLGTPAYMAPEQHRGEAATAASDQFAFCVTLFEGLFGAHPFEASSYPELLAQVLAGRYKKVSGKGVPARISRAIAKGLQPDAGQRHASMSALLAELSPSKSSGRRLVMGGALAASAIGVFFVLSTPAAAPTADCQGEMDRYATMTADATLEAARERGALPTEELDSVLGRTGPWSEALARVCSPAPIDEDERGCVVQHAHRHASLVGALAEPIGPFADFGHVHDEFREGPGGCKTPGAVARRSSLPDDPAQATRLVAWSVELARIARQVSGTEPSSEEAQLATELESMDESGMVSELRARLMTLEGRRLVMNADRTPELLQAHADKVEEGVRQAESRGYSRARAHWFEAELAPYAMGGSGSGMIQRVTERSGPTLASLHDPLASAFADARRVSWGSDVSHEERRRVLEESLATLDREGALDSGRFEIMQSLSRALLAVDEHDAAAELAERAETARQRLLVQYDDHQDRVADIYLDPKEAVLRAARAGQELWPVEERPGTERSISSQCAELLFLAGAGQWERAERVMSKVPTPPELTLSGLLTGALRNDLSAFADAQSYYETEANLAAQFEDGPRADTAIEALIRVEAVALDAAARVPGGEGGAGMLKESNRVFRNMHTIRVHPSPGAAQAVLDSPRPTHLINTGLLSADYQARGLALMELERYEEAAQFLEIAAKATVLMERPSPSVVLGAYLNWTEALVRIGQRALALENFEFASSLLALSDGKAKRIWRHAEQLSRELGVELPDPSPGPSHG